MATHGTRACYSAGCTCDVCREANRLYVQMRRRAAGVQPLGSKGPPPHGTTARYAQPWRCRCDLCRAANTQAHRRYAEARRARQASSTSDATRPAPASVQVSTYRPEPVACFKSEQELLEFLFVS